MSKHRLLIGVTVALITGMVFLSFGIFIARAAPPSNDDFNSATVITSVPYQDTFDTSLATQANDDPSTCNVNPAYTIWYAFTPSIDMAIQVSVSGDHGSRVVFGVFTGGRGNLTQIACGSEASFRVSAHTTYYFELMSLIGVGYPFGNSLQGSTGVISIIELPLPSNDNFAQATLITNLPFSDQVDTTFAGVETGEPHPSCGWDLTHTVWYAFKPVLGGSYSVSLGNINYSDSVLAVYTGTSFADLTELNCNTGWNGNQITMHLDAGTKYYIQAYREYTGDWNFSLQLDVTPAPVADFWYEPGDPNIYDNVQFINSSSDPGGLGLKTLIWDFGDGTTISNSEPIHHYTADGDYNVTLTITTEDGRTGSTTKIVDVRTHDVAITDFKVPDNVKARETKNILVSIEKTKYPETVQVDLYKSTPWGFVQVGTLTLNVPFTKGNKTTDFNFSYTFTTDDASYGKVTFKAVATITTARDALPNNNVVITTYTRVKSK